jgi:hypothetical protein
MSKDAKDFFQLLYININEVRELKLNAGTSGKEVAFDVNKNSCKKQKRTFKHTIQLIHHQS